MTFPVPLFWRIPGNLLRFWDFLGENLSGSGVNDVCYQRLDGKMIKKDVFLNRNTFLHLTLRHSWNFLDLSLKLFSETSQEVTPEIVQYCVIIK